MSPGAYPIRVELEHPLEVQRWRPFVNWLLALPHWVVLYFLGIVTSVVWLVMFVSVLFTGRVGTELYAFSAMYNRYVWRTTTFALGLRDSYPPFDFATTGDVAPDPAVFEADQPERMGRLLSLVKWLLAFPHYVALSLLLLAAFFAWPIGALAVLVTGRWPAPIHHLLVGIGRWMQRVTAYTYFMTDEYPPFSLD